MRFTVRGSTSIGYLSPSTVCSEPGWCSVSPQWKWNWIVEYVALSPPPLTSTSFFASLNFTAGGRVGGARLCARSLSGLKKNPSVLHTCMPIVCDGLDGGPRVEVDEGKVTQVVVGLNMAGDYINRRLPVLSTERTGEVSPVGRCVFCERQRHALM